MKNQVTDRLFQAIVIILLSGLFLSEGIVGATEVSVCFVPSYAAGSSCTDRIVSAIDSARASVLIQAYSFTSAPIAEAVVKTIRRGVKVQVILDASNLREGYSSLRFFQNMGVPVWIDSRHRIAHNKVIIIDSALIITGSFNFTKAAQYENAENVVFIADPDLAVQYAGNYQAHLVHSQPAAALSKDATLRYLAPRVVVSGTFERIDSK